MEQIGLTLYGGNNMISSFLGGKLKLYLGIGLATLLLSMFFAIAYLNESNKAKEATINGLNDRISSLLNERAEIERKLELQDGTHDQYKRDIKIYQHSIKSLKLAIMRLKEDKDEEPKTTVRRINAINIECLSALSEGSTSSSNCAP